MRTNKIAVELDILTKLKDMDAVVDQMKKGMTGIQLDPKSVFKKTLTSFDTEMQKFNKYSPGQMLDAKQMGEFIKSAETVSKLFTDIQGEYSNLTSMTTKTAKMLFPDAFNKNAQDALNLITQFENKDQVMNQLKTQLQEVTAEFNNANTAAKNLKEKVFKQTGSKKALSTQESEVTKQKESLQSEQEKIGADLKKSLGLKAEDVISKSFVTDTKKRIKSIEDAYLRVSDVKSNFQKLSKTTDGKNASTLQKELQQLQALSKLYDGTKKKKITDPGTENAQAKQGYDLMASGQFGVALDRTGLNTVIQYYNALLAISQLPQGTDQQKIAEQKRLLESYENTTKKIEDQEKALKTIGQAKQKEDQAKGAKAQMTDITSQIQELEKLTNISEIFNKLNAMDANPEKLSATAENLEKIKLALKSSDDDTRNKIVQNLIKMGYSAEEAESQVQGLSNALGEPKKQVKGIMEAERDLERLKFQIQHFFSIHSQIQLFKRAIRSAVDTIKELDATMTEAAVVTDFSVGDMWDKLPQYSAEASDLGATINDLYGATTLYYQQGLQSNAAMALGVETMKMARIAGMESADATQAMTSALRGFNMELNETSATRVNDVYSELAAITAADTEQIAKAMSKTASIAASANMEFETTAALLAQIIETTQEAPETAGTALKTIIARFTEVKQLFSKGQLTGEDEEGEEININKIDTALKTVGISLKDFLNGQRGLDDILLELASKWDSLDLATQRYIATTAAGSRQQSRFIAMMSDYGRTTELVNAANNSAGASQEQFNKTMDSLESKLNQLHNAWDNFLMGLTNNEVVKGVVDVLTWLLETLNKIIDGISSGSGAIKMFASALTSIMAIKGAKGILKGFGLQIPGILDILKNKNLLKGVEGTWRAKGMEIGSNFMSGWREVFGFYSKDGIQNFFKDANITDLYTFNGEELGGITASTLTDDELTKFNTQLRSIKSPAELKKFEADMAQAGYNIKMTNEATQNYNKSLKPIPGALRGVSIGGAAAGTALLVVSTAMEKAGASEKAVETVRALGLAFMSLPVILNVVQASLKATNKTLSTGKIGLILTIISAIIAAIGVLAAVIDTPAERVEKLSAAAEKAKERVEELKSELSDFNSKMEELKTSETELDGLITGTQAWKEALEGVNSQILEIIQTMPELAEYVKIGENGQFYFDPQGVEEYQEGLERGVETATQISFATDAALGYAKEDQLYKELTSSKGSLTFIDGTMIFGENETIANDVLGSLSSEELYTTLREMSESEYVAARDRLAKETTLPEEWFTQLDNAYNSIQQYADQTNSALRGMLLSNSNITNYKYGEDFINAAQPSELRGNYDYLSGLNRFQIVNEYERLTGTTITSEGKDGMREILRLNDYDEKTISKMDFDQLKNAVQGILVNEEFSGAIEDLISAIENLPEKEQKAIVAAATENWDNLSLGDIKALEGQSLTELLGLDLKNFEGEIPEAFKFFAEQQGIEVDWDKFENDEDYRDQISEQIDALLTEVIGEVEGAYSGIRQDLRNQIGFKVHALFGDLDQTATVQEYQNYANALEQVGSIVGDADRNLPEEFSGVMQEILAFAGDDADEILGALSGYDFSNPEDVKKFGQYLRNLGWPISEASRFQNELHEIIGEFNAFNPETIKDDVKKVLDFADDIQDREENALSDEEYKLAKLAGISSDDFVWNGQEWVYLDGTMVDLAAAVRENTAAMAQETRRTLEEKVAQGELFEEVINNAPAIGSGISQYQIDEFKSGEASADVIKTYLEASGLGHLLDGMTKNAQIEKWYQDHWDSYNNLTGNRGQLEAMISYYYSTAQSSQEMLGMKANNQTEIEARTRALQAAAYQEGLTDEMIEVMADSLRDQGIQIDENSDLWLAHVRDSKKARKELHELSNSLVDNYEALKDINSEGYSEALLDTVTKAQAVFGDQVDTAFVTKHIDLFLALAEGGDAAVSAWEELQELSFDAAELEVDQTSLDLINEEFQTAADWVAYLNGLNFDIYGNADLSDLFNSLDLTYEEAQELAEKIESLGGYEVTLVPYQGMTSTSGMPDSVRKLYGLDTGPDSFNVVVRKTGNGETFRSNSAGGGGGGGGSEEWENPYDKFYNITQKINEELRKRERIERRYQNLIRDNAANQFNLLAATQEEVDALKAQQSLQEQMKKGRTEQLKEWLNENASMSKYASNVITEEGEFRVDIKWDLINSITDEEEGQKIEQYISKLEEWNKSIEEVNDSLADIEDQLYEISMRGKEEYLDLEGRIKEAIVAEWQKEIDTLSTINDSINDSSSKLLDGIQKALDKERQERENAETEKELGDLQRRLAYLRQDTSGANDLEILQLEEELREGQQDYTDTLIDQKITELQEQNDEAAEQRQKQITIMEAQLAQYQDTGAIWEEVREVLKVGVSATSNLVQGSRLEELLKNGEAWESLSEIQQMDWMNELNNLIAQSLQFLANNNQLENLNEFNKIKGTTIDFITGDGKKLSGTVDDKGNVKVGNQTYSEVYQALDGTYRTIEREKQQAVVTNTATSSSKPSTSSNSGGSDKVIPPPSPPQSNVWEEAQEKTGITDYELQYVKNYFKDRQMTEKLENILSFLSRNDWRKLVGVPPLPVVIKPSQKKSSVSAFATGGLADFTGPAWLDGTKSKPELVLNARDTENFIQLKNILGSFMSSGLSKGKGKPVGDSIYDIEINVDSIGNDYDVDQLVERIKYLINEDAKYRNNNVVSLTR